MIHYNSNNENSNSAIFNVTATCVPIDSDGDGIVDARDYDSDNDGILDLIEAAGNNYNPILNIDTNGDGYDDVFGDNFSPAPQRAWKSPLWKNFLLISTNSFIRDCLFYCLCVYSTGAQIYVEGNVISRYFL